jgi:hypothetical protein
VAALGAPGVKKSSWSSIAAVVGFGSSMCEGGARFRRLSGPSTVFGRAGRAEGCRPTSLRFRGADSASGFGLVGFDTNSSSL